MSDQFTLGGSWTTSPLVGTPSGIAALAASIDEELVLTEKFYNSIPLNTDAPVTVNFGGVTNAHVLILKATGGKIRARLTSTDGAAQAVPVDDMHVSISRSTPITALDLTRLPGVVTTVDVFLGQITP